MTHAERAQALFRQGYNCAQAVFAAFCDETGLTQQKTLMLASGFGGGFGGLREVCGAVSGMTLVLSAVYGYDTADDRAAKLALYHCVQQAAEQYREENGSIVCRELLGLSGEVKKLDPAPRTQEYYKKRPCQQLVGMAAQITQDYLAAHPKAE